MMTQNESTEEAWYEAMEAGEERYFFCQSIAVIDVDSEEWMKTDSNRDAYSEALEQVLVKRPDEEIEEDEGYTPFEWMENATSNVVLANIIAAYEDVLHKGTGEDWEKGDGVAIDAVKQIRVNVDEKLTKLIDYPFIEQALQKHTEEEEEYPEVRHLEIKGREIESKRESKDGEADEFQVGNEDEDEDEEEEGPSFEEYQEDESQDTLDSYALADNDQEGQEHESLAEKINDQEEEQ